jgi:hypothetical protein
LVEGREDMLIYRKIEKHLSLQNVNFFPCEGRENLLKIYEKRAEFTHQKVLFIADKDMYVFSNIPSEYNDIIFTNGYCIENDLYTDGKERLDNLLFSEELIFKQYLIQNIVKWFAFEVEKYQNGNATNNQFGTTSILKPNMCEVGKSTLNESFLESHSFVPASASLTKKIQENYAVLLRGKYIFQVYLKIFRDFRSGKDETTYSDAQLFDICFHSGKENNNSFIYLIISKLKASFK